MRTSLGMAVVSLMLTGCGGSQTTGTLAGHLYAGGGPNPGVRPLAGSVVAEGPGGRHLVAVGSNGHYLVTLSPGTYLVSGNSPLYEGGKGLCTAPAKVAIAQGRTSKANVICREK
jgi:hypothetical protein